MSNVDDTEEDLDLLDVDVIDDVPGGDDDDDNIQDDAAAEDGD